MTVIKISEECHGFLGIAKDIKNAFQFLLKDRWIDAKTEIYDDEGGWKTLEDLRIELEFETLLETLLFLYKNDDYFLEDQFWFSEEVIIDYD